MRHKIVRWRTPLMPVVLAPLALVAVTGLGVVAHGRVPVRVESGPFTIPPVLGHARPLVIRGDRPQRPPASTSGARARGARSSRAA
ncbi:hypothetical protein [Umezawaea tangerina]|uniref:Uncharacterized protein n=1 Tax=Umezawaea tangerina TaxID=84725 RepID=A0A2T0SCF7_9PSEU|nr:hypothetical protein [Umezawaea tangerina]PRY31003.1 hypothetical protein CLV43_123105 [Umezawaea tangerina]